MTESDLALTLLSLFTLELAYYLAIDHAGCAVLAGLRVLGVIVWLWVTKRRAPRTTVDTSYHDNTVIPIDKGKRRF